jgi:hypothetical protein
MCSHATIKNLKRIERKTKAQYTGFGLMKKFIDGEMIFTKLSCEQFKRQD